MRTSRLALALIAAVALIPASAHADGLPVIDENLAPFGASTPSVDDTRYLTIPTRKGTVLAKVHTPTGAVLRSRVFPTRWSVPLVAYDGSTSGISADGTTLVLIEPRRGFPRRDTTFTVIGARGLKTWDTFTLRGDFSFDALSPDGRWLYLVQYVAAQDPFRYLVRAYDLETHKLRPKPIIDPREVGDVMRGMPLTRSYSPDGRFAYTLYDGAGEHPFIHALDTVDQSARCIDLHGLMEYPHLGQLELDVSPDGGRIAVALNGEPVALVDTKSNEVTGPPLTPEPTASTTDEPSSVPWLLLAAVATSLLLVLFGVQRLLKRPRARAE
jgi:hypothetical protein